MRRNSAKDALTSAQSSESYLKAHPEAGGDLLSDAGTVLVKISSVVKNLLEKFEKLSKYLEKLLKVKAIYDSAVKIIEAFQNVGTTDTNPLFAGGNVSGLFDILGTVVTDTGTNPPFAGGYASELIDAIANGDTNDVLEAAFGTAGSIAAGATGYSFLNNVGDMAHSYTYADDVTTSINNEAAENYHSGKTSLSETLGTGVGASTGGAIIGTVDAVFNAVGYNIPDSWSNAFIQGSATVGGYIGKGVNYVVNGVKTFFNYII